MDRLREAISILDALIAFPTTPTESNLDLVDWVSKLLEATGARIRVWTDATGEKANLFATFGPEGDGGVVLSGHTDVVPTTDQVWATDPFRLTERDGRLFGRGACDMKGFVAAVLASAPLFAEARLSRPVHIALTYDEEVGCYGAQALVESLRREGPRPAVAIIGEPTEMRIIDGHKGCCEYTTTFHGLAGHGSAPDRGVNAVRYAVDYVARLMEIEAELRGYAPVDSPFDPPWTTLQVGRIEGGAARNVIAETCALEWEMRPVCKADAQLVLSEVDRFAEETLLLRMRAVHPDSSITRETVGEMIGLTPQFDNQAVRLLSALTGRTETEVVPFGTEAGLFQELGLDCAVCGPGSIAQAHTPDEFLEISQLLECLDMLRGLARALET